MGKTKSRRHQKLYKMKGCSKKNRKNYLGGSTLVAADLNLAYPGHNVHPVPNPNLAYTGKDPYSFLHKGGANLGNSPTIPTNIPTNTNGVNPTQPNTGPPLLAQGGVPQMNPVNTQRGGSCSTCSLMKGGKKTKKGGMCPLCGLGFMVGGKKYRKGHKKSQHGGNPGYPIPNGLTGAPWVGGNLSTWPGVAGVQGENNHFADNLYKAGDPQTAMIATGANPPYSVGGRSTRGTRVTRRTRRSQKGGFSFSNLIAQDFVNLGRQFQYGLGSAYNALQGYSAPANPMPWKGQLPNTAN
jgi:hypothetical protein